MGRDRLIVVRPVAGGWRLECDATEALMFLSGARAEEKAKRLAACLAELGSDVLLSVHDRLGGLVATRRYFGDAGSAKTSQARRLELA